MVTPNLILKLLDTNKNRIISKYVEEMKENLTEIYFSRTE